MVIWYHFMHESINTLYVMLKYQIPIKKSNYFDQNHTLYYVLSSILDGAKQIRSTYT